MYTQLNSLPDFIFITSHLGKRGVCGGGGGCIWPLLCEELKKKIGVCVGGGGGRSCSYIIFHFDTFFGKNLTAYF